jgi:hypothetical protein
VSGVAGVEFAASALRAVVLRRGAAPACVEVPIDADAWDAGIAAVQQQAGAVQRIHVAIGLAHLQVAPVTVPPAPAAQLRAMLQLEPDRWFPSAAGTAIAAAVSPDARIGCAADAARITAWCDALASWAPVTHVSAAPFVLARALTAAGQPTGTFVLDAADASTPSLEVRNGVLVAVRRRPPIEDRSVQHLRVPTGVPREFAVAYAAAIASEADRDDALLTPAMERRLVQRERATLTVWASAALLAVGAALVSANTARERTLSALDAAIGTESRAAATGRASLDRALTIDRELQAVRMLTSDRDNVLSALAALGARLPTDAVAQRVRLVGTDWQIEGNARTAAAVLAALAAESHFENVRFLAPSSRFRDGATERETFAIAFTLR